MTTYIKVENGHAVEISDKLTEEQRPDRSWMDPWEYGHKTSMLVVSGLAEDLTKLTGKLYIGVDSGECVSPRYGVIEAPRVGDDVSRGFNGDFYPCGKVTKISESMKRIETVDGHGRKFVFNRRKLTGAWVQTGGTWSLVPGVISRLNPEF